MQSQDSSHPTGVRAPARVHGDSGTANADRARQRKANAAIQLKLAGATWDEIAASLGYPTPRAAIVATEQALERQLAETGDREHMRALAGARLERLLRAVWPKAIDPENPDQMTAVTKAREVTDRWIKLFGLDAPTEIVVHNPTTTELEAWVARVVSQQVPAVEEYDIIGGEVIIPDEVKQDPELTIEFEEEEDQQ